VSSHHYIGAGAPSDRLKEAADEPGRLETEVAALISHCGLTVVWSHTSEFTGGGLTSAWILSESHLVAHYWNEVGRVTVDLHICDYRQSNRVRAERLVRALTEYCFAAGSESRWSEMHLDQGLDDGAEARSTRSLS